jgi:adenine-specific DNA-methyltransferase
MNGRKQRLELTWIGKDERPRLEPRILLEDESISYHAKAHVTDNDIFDNILIHGDNLLALKALEQDFTRRVKCIYIDPPFNTGQAFEHYDDGIAHSLWLSLMRDRLTILARMLSNDGSIWVHCDDNEQAYLKVMMDEIFGRESYVATVVWESRYSRSNDASLSISHNFILVYARNPELWKTVRNRLPRTNEQAGQYRNPDNDPRGPWRAIPWDAPNIRPNLTYPIKTPSGKIRMPPEGRCWSRTEDQWLEMVSQGLAYFGKSGDGAPSFKRFLDEAGAIVPNTWWSHEDAGHTDEAKKEGHALFGKDNTFATPKPERLLHRIITIGTNPGDLVLDSFAGSGTTGAVAHKMGRRWIMVELGEHCETHIVPRLRKVIDGEDKSGITEAVEWGGGGGFRYYRLAPSLLEKDAWDNWVIAKDYYDPIKLTQAVCKLMGFVYQPDEAHYWMQGRSSESDFIYVTTQSLTRAQLAAISEEVGDERTLLVCCKAFRTDPDAFPNLTVRKIPQAVLRKCEWGKDDYSLNVASLPEAPREPDKPGEPGAAPKAKAGRKNGGKATSQDDLFSGETGK